MMEKRKYRLGDYEFDTYEEYLEAQEDLKKIDLITEEVDINDVDVAARLYTLIRNKEIVFHSKVGVNFFMYLSDIVANHSLLMAEEKRAQEDLKLKNRRRARKYRFLGVLCVLAAVACFGYFAYTDYQEEQSAQAMKRLQDMQNMTGSYIEEEDFLEQPEEVTGVDPSDATGVKETKKEASEKEATEKPKKLPDILPEYEEIYAENKDLVGWLEIEGTVINYPVLQSDSEEDSQFYLTHSFEKKKDKNGSLFMDYRNDFVDRDTNIIIYGHNMKSGAMFGSLKKYLEEDYLKKHAKIRFDTIYEHGTYEVIGAFLSEVSYQDEYAFRYYNFLNANNESEFEAFCVNVIQLSALKKGALDAKYGDQLLTLSTCSSYTDEGRMFIIAKRIE